MAWRVEFDLGVQKELDKLGAMAQRDVVAYLEKLAETEDLRKRGKPLKGNMSGFWRYRVDKYRIICRIERARLVIFVIRVGTRDKVYG